MTKIILSSLTILILLFTLSCASTPEKADDIICIIQTTWNAPVDKDPELTFKNAPTITELAKKGVYFNNAYSSSPLLPSSKKALISGLHMGHLSSSSVSAEQENHLSNLFQGRGYTILSHAGPQFKNNPEKPELHLIYTKNLKESELAVGLANKNDLIVFTSLKGMDDKKHVPENVHVPLFFYQKDKIVSGVNTNQAISTIDIFPTLLHFIGKTNIRSFVDGKDYSVFLNTRNTEASDRILYWKSLSDKPRHSLLFNQWLLIQENENTEWRLYDLLTDSLKQDNIIHYHPGKTKRFKEWIEDNQ